MVMPFRRRMNPIQSYKHIIDAGGGLTSTVSTVDVSQAVQARTGASPNECVIGETVNGLFVIVNILGATGQGVTGPVDWYIIKQRSNQAVGTLPDPGNTGNDIMRSQIFHEEKGVSGSADGTPHVFKGVIVVPPNMRRQREGDKFLIRLKMTDPDTGTFCVKVIYKSFS